MSISLSGGDIAFIAAFIVLPTFILASCIWAIVAIRAGVLLPQRAALVAREDDAEAMPPTWPYVAGEQTASDAAEPPDWQPAETLTGTAEHTAILPDPPPAREADAEIAGQLSEDPDDAPMTSVSHAPIAPIATEQLDVMHDHIDETGEFPLVPSHDWSRPSDAGESSTTPSQPLAAEAQTPVETAETPEVETWDTEPEPEPEPVSSEQDDDQDEDEPLPDEFFEHTTDLPLPAAIKRKPPRKAVAQLRPPVASGGRSLLRPGGSRRPGDAPDGNGLATEDEGAVQGDDGPVHIRRADDE